jgi:hypothetical protein
MRASLRQLGFALAVLFTLSGCNSPKDRIVGRWEVQGGTNPMVWEFAKNGAVKSGNISGKYTFASSDRLKIQTQFATFVYSIRMDGDTMTWTEPNGTRTQLKKVP